MNSQREAAPQDVTEAVLDAMLGEALALTDEIAAAGAVRRALSAPDSRECAKRLRLAARLSRIAAWASLRASHDPERLAIASAALQGASAPNKLLSGRDEARKDDDDLAPFIARVDRIVARAHRLDALLDGAGEMTADAVERSQPAEGSAVILPFRRPVEAAAEPACGGIFSAP